MLPTRHSLTTPTLHLSYLEWPTANADVEEPVVLLHGLADHGLVWQSLAAVLCDRHRCIAPDLRGHGHSDKPEDPAAYQSRHFVADLDALASECMNGQSQSTISVVAHSWAAKLALMWAKRRPQLIRRLVLVDPFFVNKLPGILRPTFPIFYRILPFLRVMGPFAHYDEAVAIARQLKQYRGWSPLQASVFEAAMEEKPDGTWGSKFAIAARNGVFLDTIQQAGLTEPVDNPTVLLLPEQGLNRQPWQLKPYQTFLSQLTIQTIPGNHWPHLVKPDAFNQAVAAILQSSKSPLN